jgi:hypothetical protein
MVGRLPSGGRSLPYVGRMATLTLWDSYTREQVHGIFSPDTTFTPQAGTWGLQGIVRVPERAGSYVFLVTFGKKQGAHSFDESITDDGVLTWQSQPSQTLTDARIQDFIHHDDRTDSIYLFLRTRADLPYTYCGTVGYLAHDTDREQPVHFQWQLLDWPAPPKTLTAMGLILVSTSSSGAVNGPLVTSPTQGGLIETPPPAPSKPGGAKTSTFNAVKRTYHPDQDARNKKLGLVGELLVFQSEKQHLLQAGRADLSKRVLHVSVTEGDGAGYDIRSFAPDGTVRHLEVKTTRGGVSTGFFISPNEVAFSEAHPDSFELVRVYDYNQATQSGSCYRLSGPARKTLTLEPSQYRASLA